MAAGRAKRRSDARAGSPGARDGAARPATRPPSTPISGTRSIPACRTFRRPDHFHAPAMPDENLNGRIQQIEGLIRKTEALPDPNARSLALELCQAVLGFHAAALERLIEIISEGGEPCTIVNALAADDLTSSLLLLHGLHPHSLEERV